MIHRHGMEADTAKEVEAALIDAYAGLNNIQTGFDSNNRGVMHTNEVIRVYEAPEAVFKHKLILINVNKSNEDRELIDAVRYVWKISPDRGRKADYVLAVRRGRIIGAFKAEEWLRATKRTFRSCPVSKGAMACTVGEAPDDVKNLYLQTDRRSNANVALQIRFVILI